MSSGPLSEHAPEHECPQATHLILTLKRNEFLAHGTSRAADHRRKVSRRQRRTAGHVRLPRGLVERPAHLPERVEAKPVCAFAELEERDDPHSMVRRSHRPKMDTPVLRKRLRPPAGHSSAEDGNHIDPAAFEWLIPSDLLVAGPAKQLAGPGDVIETAESIVVDLSAFIERCPREAKVRIFRESVEQVLEILRDEGDIRVEAPDDVVSNCARRSRPTLNAPTFPAKSRLLRSGIRTSSIHGCAAAARFPISSVRSVEPSLTITHRTGLIVCETTDSMVRSRYASSLRAGVTSTYRSEWAVVISLELPPDSLPPRSMAVEA